MGDPEAASGEPTSPLPPRSGVAASSSRPDQSADPEDPIKAEPPRPSRDKVAVQARQESAIDDTEELDDEVAEPPQARSTAAAPVVRQHRLDPAHEALGGPHFDLQAFLAQDTRKPGRSESIWGQVLAYLGVGLITVGTTIVLWAWFKQTQHLAPTGWLICTVGQMLLFLGVITLVSGGMQQTSHEVTRRVEYLGDRILRFEQSAEQAMRAPHFEEMRNRKRSRPKAAQTQRDEELDS